MLRLLSPFAHTYRKLDLSSRWWHRLAIVAFVCLMLLSLGIAIFAVLEAANGNSTAENVASQLGFDTFNSRYPAVPDRYTYGFKLNNGYVPMVAPDGKRYLVPNTDMQSEVDQGWKPETFKVDVPEIGAVTFVNLSKEEAKRKADDLYRVYRAEMRAAYAEAVFWAVVSLFCVFYLSQIIYRTFIYIVFGRPRSRAASAL